MRASVLGEGSATQQDAGADTRVGEGEEGEKTDVPMMVALSRPFLAEGGPSRGVMQRECARRFIWDGLIFDRFAYDTTSA